MHWEFVIPGYLIVFGGLATYALSLLGRIRKVAERVPDERRRFLE
ncbi:MAG: hypothetical protein ACN4GZ_16290 [Acidimicrobiales bacterium]